MAILDNTDFNAIAKLIKKDPTEYAEFKAWGLSKSVWKSAFQTAEDWFIDGFLVSPTTSFKAEIETVTGATTNARAKAVGYAWMGWRYRRNP